MTDQAADIAQFAVRVLWACTTAHLGGSVVLTDYRGPAFGQPVRMSNHAGFPLFLLPSVFLISSLYPKTLFHPADCLQVAGFASKPGNIIEPV